MESINEAYDWCALKAQGKWIGVKKREAINHYWQDPITGTTYFIATENYETILKKGYQQLQQYAQEKDLKKIEEFLYDSQRNNGLLTDNDDVLLFPQLPYQNQAAYRICDYLLIRTALLYCLNYDQKSEWKQEEKDSLRLQGLTWQYGTKESKSAECADLKWIEDFLINPVENDDSRANHKIDLVKGGMVKIKQYFLETSSIPEIRGASHLLNIVNETQMKNLICAKHIRECLVYVGGGKMLGIFPVHCGESICTALEKEVEQWTVTAQSNFSKMECSLKSLFEEKAYQQEMDKMEILLEERQGLRWDFRVEPPMTNLSELQTEMKEGFKDYSTKSDKVVICESCRHRNAQAVLQDVAVRKKVCPSCLYKNLYGSREEKKSIIEKYINFVNKQCPDNKSLSANKSEMSFDTLEAISKSSKGFIGIIYGDANNMSKVFGRVKSLMEMKYFSEEMSDTVTDIVFDSLHKNLGDSLSFEIIAVGGDDILLIVPGKYAYDIAITMGQAFDEQFKNRTADSYNMTMSLGVCITHFKKPIQYIFDIAQQLLKSAKKKAWEEDEQEQQQGRSAKQTTGTIDWMVIENDIAGGSSLSVVRENISGKAIKTLRPYNWETAKLIKSFIDTLSNEKTFVFNLRQSWYLHEKAEGELFYEYQLGKEKARKGITLKALESLAEALGEEPEDENKEAKKEIHPPWICLNGKDYSPWLDAVELWDYVTGGSNGKG
jgi:hypothetical protein